MQLRYLLNCTLSKSLLTKANLHDFIAPCSSTVVHYRTRDGYPTVVEWPRPAIPGPPQTRGSVWLLGYTYAEANAAWGDLLTQIVGLAGVLAPGQVTTGMLKLRRICTACDPRRCRTAMACGGALGRCEWLNLRVGNPS